MKQGAWIKQFPTFNDDEPNDASDNVSPNLLIWSPLSLVLAMIFSCVDNSNVGMELYRWAKEHQQCSNLKGTNLWDRRWTRMMSFELQFIKKYEDIFFLHKADYQQKGVNIAEKSDWRFSPWLLTNVTKPAKKRMVTELEDYLTATPESALRPAGYERMQLRSSGVHAFGKSADASDSLSCALHAIDVLMIWITGKSILRDANQQFPLTNNIGISFGMLCSVKSFYQQIAWSALPVDTSLQGSKTWKTKLFRDAPLGYYWVQLDLKRSTLAPAEHVCAVHIFKDWRTCDNSSQRIAKIIDNRGRTDYIQKEDVEDLSDQDIGDKIFHLFLDMKYSRLTNMINLKRRQHKDSAYHHAVETETRCSSRSVTRQFAVNEKFCVQKDKKVKKAPLKRRKPMDKILDKYAKRT